MLYRVGALLAALALAMPAAQAAPRKLLVISVDGLDWRYIRDRDALGLKIPNIRRLLAKSQVADGVTGVWPTITLAIAYHHADGRSPRSARHPGECQRPARPGAKLLVGDQDQGAHPDPVPCRCRAHNRRGQLAGDGRCEDQLEPARGLCQAAGGFL